MRVSFMDPAILVDVRFALMTVADDEFRAVAGFPAAFPFDTRWKAGATPAAKIGSVISAIASSADMSKRTLRYAEYAPRAMASSIDSGSMMPVSLTRSAVDICRRDDP